MKVSYTIFSQNTPVRNLYQQSIDYIRHDFDLKLDDAFFLLKELAKSTDCRNSLWVETSSSALDFHLAEDNTLWVEVYGDNNGLWAISEIDLTIGEEILKIAFEGKDFGEVMPTTNKNWNAYTPLQR